MPDWYRVISGARYARMPAPDYAALPFWWQDVYETARLAEFEAGLPDEPEDGP